MNVGKHDIAFSVEFIPGSTGTNETQPAQVVQHKLRLTKDQNAFTPESELGGILRFTFDNKYSMMRGKEIDLSYEITENPWVGTSVFLVNALTLSNRACCAFAVAILSE